MRIAISSDHAGFALKTALIAAFSDSHEFIDHGAEAADQPCAYPDQANLLAETLHSDPTITMGVLICGSGVGISIAGNRHRHLRVALCSEPEVARLSRAHNDANVLAFGARFISPETAVECLRVFIREPFEGGRHVARVEKLY